MPQAPRTLRPRGGVFRSAQEREREHDRRRRRRDDWRGWYGLAAWRRRRARQLAREPLCRIHAASGGVVTATVADHVEPHRGDWEKFIRGELQSLCKRCHDSVKQAEERAAAKLASRS